MIKPSKQPDLHKISALYRTSRTPQSRRKSVASTLDYLITVFDGDADAMYEAIAEYRAKQQKPAGGL